MTEIERFNSLKESIKVLSDKLIRIEERHRSEKERLQEIINRIAQKGYDPTKMNEIRAQKQTVLDTALKALEIQVQDLQGKVREVESSIGIG